MVGDTVKHFPQLKMNVTSKKKSLKFTCKNVNEVTDNINIKDIYNMTMALQDHLKNGAKSASVNQRYRAPTTAISDDVIIEEAPTPPPPQMF